jgi:MazG family protein
MVERTAMAESPQSVNPKPCTFNRLCEIVAKLRAPGGCPWDAEQTNESLLPALIEEAYEVVEVARAKNDPHFQEELGDLLLLVVMHAEIASELGRFNIDNVIREVTEKLVRRHPHVFGNLATGVSPAKDASVSSCAAGTAATTDSVVRQWEAIKRAEKKSDKHYLASLPRALPALVRAEKAQKKVARVNFDWEKLEDVIAKVDEEVSETKAAIQSWHRHPADGPSRTGSSRPGSPCHEIEDEIGDLLFAVVNLSRKCGIDAESALQKATDKFRGRFNRLEEELQSQGKRLGEVNLAEMDAIWNRIKGNVERPTPNTERPTSELDIER